MLIIVTLTAGGDALMVRLILNILWLVLGGIWSAIAWFLVGILAAITIVGLPWARSP
jgi:uncharacterized membrane protein YccF (DUF307 family)